MTKKDFEALATELGFSLRWADGDRAAGVREAVAAVCVVAARTNPRFDSDRFCLWVEEVATGVRDLDGRKWEVSA